MSVQKICNSIMDDSKVADEWCKTSGCVMLEGFLWFSLYRISCGAIE